MFKHLTLLVLLLSSCLSSHAQFGKLLKKVVEDKVEKVLDNEIEEVVGVKDSVRPNASSKPAAGGAFGSAFEKPKATYKFNKAYYAKLTYTERRSRNNYEMKQNVFYSDLHMDVAMKDPGKELMSAGGSEVEAVVMDFDKSHIYSFMNDGGRRAYVGLPMDAARELVEDPMISSVIQGAEHKQIAGYKCSEWIAKSSDFDMHLWITDQTVFELKEFNERWGSMMRLNKKSNWFAVNKMHPKIAELLQDGRTVLAYVHQSHGRNNMRTEMEILEFVDGANFYIDASNYENLLQMD